MARSPTRRWPAGGSLCGHASFGSGGRSADDVVALGLAGFDVGEPDWFSAPLDAPAWTQVVAYDGVVPVATGFEPAYGVVQRPR